MAVPSAFPFNLKKNFIFPPFPLQNYEKKRRREDEKMRRREEEKKRR